MKKVELLSPAGDFECLKAAVQNGADSVYFGGSLFNARASAGNFDTENLKKAIEYCALRNVKTHLTLNTLIKDTEFDDAIALAKQAYEFGIDAMIVQDIGLARFLMQNFPNLPLHASTQMSIHNIEGVKEAEALGFQRVVLARELPLQDIEYICRHSHAEVEVFIHGALCICYSGQCLFSSTVGGRSGNRGKCAQPCRLPYELISQSCDSSTEEVIDKGYLLSPRDLCGLNFIPALIDAGVSSFKIEGRMKTPEYVATVTRIYRKYIDMALSGENYMVDKKDVHDLMQVFNRGGFSSGHLDDEANFDLIFKEKSNNMGLYLGNISYYNKAKGHVTLTLNENLRIGDTISFENEPSKYTVSELMMKSKNLTSCSPRKNVTIGRMKGNIKIGDKVYKLASKTLSTYAENSYKICENRKIPLHCKVFVKKNEPISLRIFTKSLARDSLYHNIDISVASSVFPVPAIKSPITEERIIEQINKTTNTPYEFKNIKVYLEAGLQIPTIRTLNELRRSALGKLEEEILSRKRRQWVSQSIAKVTPYQREMLAHPKISLFLRELHLDEDYTKLDHDKIDKMYLPLKAFIHKDYRDILHELSATYEVYLYMPTIIRSNYKNIILTQVEHIVKEFHIRGFVVSNLGDIKLLGRYAKDYDFIGNYSLNVFNHLAIQELQSLGLHKITVSRELDKNSLNELLSHSQMETEVIVYGNLPLMATNYCFLGQTNKCYPKCGLNCQKKKRYYLKDRMGLKFRIIPDSIQTVTLIFNSKILSIATEDIFTNRVRADMLDESVEQINHVLDTVYHRKRLEGRNYTNGNLNKEV